MSPSHFQSISKSRLEWDTAIVGSEHGPVLITHRGHNKIMIIYVAFMRCVINSLWGLNYASKVFEGFGYIRCWGGHKTSAHPMNYLAFLAIMASATLVGTSW